MSSENTEEARVRQAIVDCTVEHYDLLANAQASNVSAAALSSSAEDAAKGLTGSLQTLQSSSQLLYFAGQAWRQEKSLLRSAVISHQKIVALMEAPALVEECVRHNMFHEALLIFEHVMMLCQHMSDVYVFQRLQAEVVAAMELVVDAHVMPMLSGPLSVDTAYKAISLLRRLGGSPACLCSLFLTSRATYIAHLMQEADASVVPYSRLLKYVTVYKVHVSEVVLQYKACFPSPTEAQQRETTQELSLWCQEQAHRFVSLVSATLQHLHNGSELALVIQQCSSCATTTARVHTDVSGLLGSVLVEKVRALFADGMRQARMTYRTSMQTSSWRVSVYCHHNTSLTFSTAIDAPATVGDTPAVQLAQWLPLAYALNGTLSSFNAIRKCLLPGVEASCGEEVYRLVVDVAQDMLTDIPLLDTMDGAEKGVFVTFVKAFKRLYVPYVLHLVSRILGPAHREVMEDRLQGVMHDVNELLFLVDPPPAAAAPTAGEVSRLASRAATAMPVKAAAPPPPPPPSAQIGGLTSSGAPTPSRNAAPARAAFTAAAPVPLHHASAPAPSSASSAAFPSANAPPAAHAAGFSSAPPRAGAANISVPPPPPPHNPFA
ncbi:putative oligomeric golgi complex component 8 [Leptomonas pyrrhocoris]|uniref:Conserved oligomeric Golgi complex subunit 8 n=1 Tax=Leptomonas pyrrhocoris TaxID=157538 RepID=A0A0N0VHD4_LEPPY|nr:putative oligomeric golgi complex component 8 [Leptomonas pyrrhocoris]KPA85078.1 putative oligomeric golgi complex component 8 [Leptomonas pyrrhocoris]|eukprot:XP_015663517.1 putative oligomeric golgi complex component 8 [Leptomonas pyrrhocoris]